MLPTFEFDIVNFMYILMFFLVVFMAKNGYFKGFWKITFEEFKKRKVKILITLVIVVLLILFVDKPVALFFKNIQAKNNEMIPKFVQFGYFLGDSKYVFSFLIFGAMVYKLFDNEKMTNIFYTSLISSGIMGVVVLIAKTLILRQRPYFEFNPFLIFSYGRAIAEGKVIGDVYNSMPSGHTITITGAMIVFALCAKNKYLRVLFFLIPLITAFARVYVQKHWVSDVFVAYLIGIIGATVFYKINEHRIK